jgi:hypothetical protein
MAPRRVAKQIKGEYNQKQRRIGLELRYAVNNRKRRETLYVAHVCEARLDSNPATAATIFQQTILALYGGASLTKILPQ